MISLNDFYRVYLRAFDRSPNSEQKSALEAAPAEPLFIVAGPGTGKTTCLTLRIMKLVLVDDVPPKGILATTFTRKAASELRSRILGSGFRLIEALQGDSQLSQEQRERLKQVDMNQVMTGTVDSICEELLRRFRSPGEQPPILIDDNVSKTLLLREGIFSTGLYQDEVDPDLRAYLLPIHGGNSYGFNVGRMNDLLQSIWDRRIQDQVNWQDFLNNGQGTSKGRKCIDKALTAYEKALNGRGMVDFALLGQRVLDRFRVGDLSEFATQIKVVLVDEYQDTNLLQETIYFEMSKCCNGALSVVGDDDQSLYRFRGATVELFSDFDKRYTKVFKTIPERIFLKDNYRSTQAVVNLVNGYVTLDPTYRKVRIKKKPALSPKSGEAGGPVLCMFRNDVASLANSLAEFIGSVFRGNGVKVPGYQTIKKAAQDGDLGDCALLCSSPSEFDASGNPRLPLLLRQALLRLAPKIETFNPRGQDLSGIPLIQQFGGLLLECLDPGGIAESVTSLSQDVRQTFRTWRNASIAYFNASKDKSFRDYVTGWAKREPRRKGYKWPRLVSVLELVYGLVHFFPELHDDAEGQVYLEAFTRQVAACEQVGKFKSRVVTDRNEAEASSQSLVELLRDFLRPIAAGTVKVNEDLIDAFPRDRLTILSVHQAKGLEFPLTIVDVGSDFRTNSSAQKFKRFPETGATPHIMEDYFRPHTDLKGPLRSGRDRAFDDLYRQFFVAYSRPQQILLLVGLTTNIPGEATGIRNVATGWTRGGEMKWPVPILKL
jgi:DNA helicase II / ATP-dependent DNA helicase PcrA